ncbi:MAG: hypothetical protein A2655_01425 [Candidatus Yanofskybacteria bacterium RIFCSPHIGHO2_01_FULL_43_42]|uniref:Uncharacterized protein n=1 Tax=Candidatus Yanofskybacteria bacterium RIFCSPLOWO2_01_FULL_43_22 TaxID=1802695 RepID=A0A1F8GGN7_9BACT|nr:MAG: hypothetical protein A2655_01425 [Candidatus Yanofskybacteria bacterium RIFCSPHIGHO2_01_FULL_43_42]OGN24557.1 MAG: hypothetical protein A3A13_00555 [Candidatus Yanofskybacteria bacterium RIFCSPLOWO2_01_FULL_43_22]
MLVPCPFRGDHMIRKGRMHGPSQCPPLPGEYGEHRRNKRLRRRRAKRAAEFSVGRGEAIAGTGKPSASSEKRAGVKDKLKKLMMGGAK